MSRGSMAANSTERIVIHAPHNLQLRRQILRFVAMAMVTLCGRSANVTNADDRGWEFEPYRIHAVLAIDMPGGIAERLSGELPQYLERRVVAAIGPAWEFKLQIATGSLRRILLSGLAKFDGPPTKELPAEGDKLLLLSIRGTPSGYELSAREFDRTVGRWGTTLERQSGQSEMLPEQLFAIVWQTVAPLAQLELDPSDNSRVVLIPRVRQTVARRQQCVLGRAGWSLPAGRAANDCAAGNSLRMASRSFHGRTSNPLR